MAKVIELMKQGSMGLPLELQSRLRYEKLTGASGLRTRALWEQIFTEDTESFLTYYYGEKIMDAQIHVLSDESGQIVSMVHANPYVVMLHGVRRQAYYIVGVATAQPYRHRGCMAFLLQKAVLQAKSEDCPFVFLMPADAAIYEPFGFRFGAKGASWGRSAELKTLMELSAQAHFRTDDFAADIAVTENPAADNTVTNDPAAGFTLTVYTKADAGVLASYAAGALARRYDTYCVHDEAYFDRLSRELLSEGGALYLLWKRTADSIGMSDKGGATDKGCTAYRLCGYFCYVGGKEEYLQEVIVEPEARRLFSEKESRDRIMFLLLEEGISCGRAYFPEEV